MVYRPGPQPISARLFPPLLSRSALRPSRLVLSAAASIPPLVHHRHLRPTNEPNPTPPLLPINATHHRCRSLCAPRSQTPILPMTTAFSLRAAAPATAPCAGVRSTSGTPLSIIVPYLLGFPSSLQVVETCFVCSLCCSGEGRARVGGAGGTRKDGGACSGCSCVTLLF